VFHIQREVTSNIFHFSHAKDESKASNLNSKALTAQSKTVIKSGQMQLEQSQLQWRQKSRYVVNAVINHRPMQLVSIWLQKRCDVAKPRLQTVLQNIERSYAYIVKTEGLLVWVVPCRRTQREEWCLRRCAVRRGIRLRWRRRRIRPFAVVFELRT